MPYTVSGDRWDTRPPSHTHYENLTFDSQTDRSLLVHLRTWTTEGGVIFLHLIEVEAAPHTYKLHVDSHISFLRLFCVAVPPLSRSCDTTIANTLDLSEFNILYPTQHLLRQYDIEKV